MLCRRGGAIIKPETTTDEFADDKFESADTDEAWPEDTPKAEPADAADDIGQPLRKRSALRSIEECSERERLRRELDDLGIWNGAHGDTV